MGKLSQHERDELPSHVYGLPDKRAYPMPDRGHAQYAIKVAAIQHAHGNLSAEEYGAIHAKAMGVLHAANGGMVSLRGKSNMQRDFARHGAASVRQMADGGVVNENAFDTKLGQQHGTGDYSLYDETGGLKSPQQIAHEAGFPMTPSTGSLSALNAAKVAAPPSPIPNPSVHTNTIGVRGANGGHVSLRNIESMGRNGMVHGPGGPRDDMVPAKLSDGEYVLPAKTVAHVGKENLDALVQQTNDGRQPGIHSLREHYADGGQIGPDGVPILNDVAPENLRGGVRVPPPPKAVPITPQASELPPPNGNPNVSNPRANVDFDPTSGAARKSSPEAAAYEADQAARAGIGSPKVAPTAAPAAPSSGPSMFGSQDDWKRYGNTLRDGVVDDARRSFKLAPGLESSKGVLGSVARGVGKIAGPVAVGSGALETAAGLANHDYGKAAVGALDTAAGIGLATPAAPAAAMYLGARTGWEGGKAAGQAAYSHLSEDVQNKIGGTINQIGQNLGGLWGTNDDTKIAQDQAARASLRMQPNAAATAAPVTPLSSGDESEGLDKTPAPDRSPQGNEPGSAGLTGTDANGNRTIGYDGSPESLKAAQDAYYKEMAHPTFDPTHSYSYDASGNFRDSGPSNSPANVARYNAARARALDPDFRPENIQAAHDAVDDKYRTGNQAESLRGASAPGSWDWLQGRKDRRMAQEEARSLREDSTARRGQDITAQTQTYGHELSARTARMQARMEQFNKDRTYNFDVAKSYGTGGPGTGGGEVGRAEQKAREDAAKTTQDRVASMLPPTKDAKGNTVPDTANAARYAAGLNAVLGQKVEATKQYLAKNPNDTNAQQWLARANRDGLAALDESDVRKHVAGMQAADLAQQEHSAWNPLKGSAVTSDAPITSLRAVHRTILPDYYQSDRGDKIPAYAVDKAGALIMGMGGGQPNRNFEILKQPQSLRGN